MSNNESQKEIFINRINKTEIDKKRIEVKIDKENIIVYDKKKFEISK